MSKSEAVVKVLAIEVYYSLDLCCPQSLTILHSLNPFIYLFPTKTKGQEIKGNWKWIGTPHFVFLLAGSRELQHNGKDQCDLQRQYSLSLRIISKSAFSQDVYFEFKHINVLIPKMDQCFL